MTPGTGKFYWYFALPTLERLTTVCSVVPSPSAFFSVGLSLHVLFVCPFLAFIPPTENNELSFCVSVTRCQYYSFLDATHLKFQRCVSCQYWQIVSCPPKTEEVEKLDSQ